MKLVHYTLSLPLEAHCTQFKLYIKLQLMQYSILKSWLQGEETLWFWFWNLTRVINMQRVVLLLWMFTSN